jgi:hypothetical protein
MMKSIRLILIVCYCVQLGACAMWRPKPVEPAQPTSPDAKYTQPELDSLLNFADALIKRSPHERLPECEHVLLLTSTDQGVGVALHLYIAQILTEACGDIHETWERIQAGKSEIKDGRVLSLVGLVELLQSRYEGEAAQRRELEHQLKQTSQQAKSTHRQMKSRESEIKELQDKLDALKSIEQNLGVTPSGQ